jgi:tetratricopeptide (TPR) repeat protein
MPLDNRRVLVASLLGCLCLPALLSVYAQNAAAVPEGQELMQRGAAAMRQGKLAEAEQDFRKALAEEPHSADASMALGMTLLRESKAEEAKQALEQATAIDPRIRGARMFLGILDYQRGDFDAALTSLHGEETLQPNNPEVLTWIGIVELGAGHPEDATDPLDRASALEPRDLSVLYYRGRAHTLVAQQTYKKLFALGPDSWQLHRAMGEIYSQSQQHEKAIAEFQAALEKQPNDPDLYQDIADQDQRLSRWDDATTAYRQELKLHPGDAAALYGLGKIQVQTGDPTEGVALLQQAAEAHAAPGPTQLYLGIGLSKMGRDAEGAASLEKSLASDPDPFVRRSAWFELVRVYRRLNRTDDALNAAEEVKKLDAAAQGSSADQNGSPEP